MIEHETYIVTTHSIAGFPLDDFLVEIVFKDGRIVSETVRTDEGMPVPAPEARDILEVVR